MRNDQHPAAVAAADDTIEAMFSAQAEVADEPTEEALTASREISIDTDRYSLDKYFEFREGGLRIKHQPSLEKCGELMAYLKTANKGLQFAIGDAVIWIRAKYNEEASQIIDAGDWTESTIEVYAWVAESVPPKNRRMGGPLSFDHHQTIAKLPVDEQVNWLKRAEKGDGDGLVWSSKRLRKEIAAFQAEAAGANALDVKVIFTVTVKVASPDQQNELVRQLTNLGYDSAVIKLRP